MFLIDIEILEYNRVENVWIRLNERITKEAANHTQANLESDL